MEPGGAHEAEPVWWLHLQILYFFKKQKKKPNLWISIRRIFIFPTLSRHALPRAASSPPPRFSSSQDTNQAPTEREARSTRGVFVQLLSCHHEKPPQQNIPPPPPREPRFCIDRIESADFKQGPVGQGGERGAGHSPTAHMGPGEDTPSFTATGSLHWSLWSLR